MNRGIDLTPVTRPLRLPVGSDIRLQVAVTDKTGVPVDLTGTTLTIELLTKATRHVELTLTADTNLAATGTIDFTATSAAIAEVTETALTWRLRDTTTNVDWITGPATITTTGQTAPGTATIPVSLGTTVFNLTLTGVSPAGSGKAVWGAIAGTITDQTDLVGLVDGAIGSAVPRASEVSADPGVPLLRHDRNYPVTSTDADIMQFWSNGTRTAWLNEWGGLRGKPPSGNNADAVVRAFPHQNVTVDGPNGPFEIMSKDGASKVAVIRWDGGRVRNGIDLSDVVVLGKLDPVPPGLPAGVLIVRVDGV